MSTPDTQRPIRAALITKTGSSEAIQIGELPIPQPGPTDVLVEVDIAAVVQFDTSIRAGTTGSQNTRAFPFIVGRDHVGNVKEARPGRSFTEGGAGMVQQPRTRRPPRMLRRLCHYPCRSPLPSPRSRRSDRGGRRSDHASRHLRPPVRPERKDQSDPCHACCLLVGADRTATPPPEPPTTR